MKDPYFIVKISYTLFYRKDLKSFATNPAEAGLYEKKFAVDFAENSQEVFKAVPAGDYFKNNDKRNINEMIERLEIIRRSMEQVEA